VLKADVQAALTCGRAEPVQAGLPGRSSSRCRSAGAISASPSAGCGGRSPRRWCGPKFTAPHSLFVEEVDVTELVALRRRLNASLAAVG
jgi:pyruvate dehydrogenase E2 component (dihydrolipoamide acetyltransferase)